jgi:hypothetical protein
MRLIDADALIEVLSNKDLKECFLTNASGVIQLLKDTPTIEDNDLIAGMISDDYKERFKAEYKQLIIRMNRLEDIINKIEYDCAEFKPTCSLILLKRQYSTMISYASILEDRAGYEGINLD